MAATHFSGPLFSGGVPLFGNADASYFGTQWFVDTVNGSDSYDGRSPDRAFRTMGRALWLGTITAGVGEAANVGPNDTIWFVGTVREQLLTPLHKTINGVSTPVTGVSINGMAGGGVRDDDAAKWTYPSSGATAGMALIAPRQQGWVFNNFLMTPEPTSGACINMPNTGTSSTGEGGHLIANNMRFVGIDVTTTYGIVDPAGCGFVTINNCQFFLLTTGIYNSATPNAIPLGWRVTGNRFIDNTNHIVMSSSKGIFTDNVFVTEATTNIDLISVSGQGGNNVVRGNVFHNAAADITISDGYQGSATDQWSDNYATDQAVYGVPA